MTMSYRPSLVLAAEGDVVQHNKLLKYLFCRMFPSGLTLHGSLFAIYS